MSFTVTPFDKAILAAILAPLTVLATTYVNGQNVTEQDVIAAIVAAVIAGLGVYLKGNKSA